MNHAVVKMQSHRAPLTSLAVDLTGNYLVSTGMDSQVKVMRFPLSIVELQRSSLAAAAPCALQVWDIRKFQPLHTYFTPTPVRESSISQRGLLALGYGTHIKVCHWSSPPFIPMSASFSRFSLLPAGVQRCSSQEKPCPVHDPPSTWLTGMS